MKRLIIILFFLISTVLGQGLVSQEINKNTYSNPQLTDYIDNSMSMLWVLTKNSIYPQAICTVFSFSNHGIQEWVTAAHCVLDDDTRTKIDPDTLALYVGMYRDNLQKVNVKSFSYDRNLSYDYVRLTQENNINMPDLSFEGCKTKPTPGEMVWTISSPAMIMPILMPGYYSGELKPGNSALLKLFLGNQTYFYYLITQRLYPGASGSPTIKLENNKYCVFGIVSFYYKEDVFPFYAGSIISRMY